MTTELSEFEQLVIAFALDELSLREMERWVYDHPNELKAEIGPDLQMEVLSADYSSDESVINVLNSWFRNRFPNRFADMDLRSLRGSHSSKRFKDRVRRSLA